jgi:hypothetical protein
MFTGDAAPAASLRAVANRLGLRVYNVNVYLLKHELHIDLDLEVADHLSLERRRRGDRIAWDGDRRPPAAAPGIDKKAIKLYRSDRG